MMPSTALRCAVSEDRGGTRARQGPGLRACTHLLLHPMQDSSTIRHACEQLLTLTIRATRDRLTALSTAGTAQRTRDVYYQSHALPLQTNHQQRKPTRPPPTTTAATEIPAIAPVLRPPLLTEGSAGLTAGVCVT